MTTTERLRELLRKATPGPWNHEDGSARVRTSNGWCDFFCEGGEADAAIIVATINAIPALLAVVSAANTVRELIPAAAPGYDDIGGIRALKEALANLEKETA